MKKTILTITVLALSVILFGCGKRVCIAGIGQCDGPDVNTNPVEGDQVKITLPNTSIKLGSVHNQISVTGCDPAPCSCDARNINPTTSAPGSFSQGTGTILLYDAPPIGGNWVEFDLYCVDDRYRKSEDLKGTANVHIHVGIN